MADYKLPMDYIDVQTRIVEFRTKYPQGSLQQVSIDFREVAGTAWVIYTAAAYRTPDDERPGIGTAWERIPGKTNFTRDSEVQNAETAAWGRAIVASLAADTKKGIASAEEVRNRQAPVDYQDAAPFLAAIKDAPDEGRLKLVGAQIATAELKKADRDELRNEYNTRLAELVAS